MSTFIWFWCGSFASLTFFYLAVCVPITDCLQRGSLCQDPAGIWTTRRPDDREETQIEVVWTCLPFIRSGQIHLARHSERGKKTRQTEEEVGRQHQGMDRPGVRQVPEGSGERRKMWETGCEVICGAPTTPVFKGQVMAKVSIDLNTYVLTVYLLYTKIVRQWHDWQAFLTMSSNTGL